KLLLQVGMIRILFLFLNFLIHFLLSLITRSNRARPVVITSSSLKPYSFTIISFSLSEETINLSATFLSVSFSYKLLTYFEPIIPWRKKIRFFVCINADVLSDIKGKAYSDICEWQITSACCTN